MNTALIPRDMLEAPFPPDLIKSRPGAFGNSLSYLEGHTVIGRLNEAFDGNWSFEIVTHQVLDEEVLVLAKFRCESAGVVKMAFGSSKITRDQRSGNPIALGDDLKAAATDALKKAATLLGVGLSLYGGQPTTDPLDDRPFDEDLRDKPTPSNGNNRPSTMLHGNGTGQTNGRITSRQLGAVFAIARERKMSNQAVRDMVKEMFTKNIDYLSKQEASSLIEHLLAQ